MGLMQYLVAERAITYEQREIVIHALMHIPPEEITLDTAKVLVVALIVGAQKRIARLNRRRPDGRAQRQSDHALNLFRRPFDAACSERSSETHHPIH